MTTATVKGKALWQKTRQMLGRGYHSLTTKELQLARFLQQKIPAGYEITRFVFLLIKVALIILLFMIALWLVFAVLAIIAVIVSLTDNQKDSQKILEETPGSFEHSAKYPWEYDEWGNHRG